MSDAGRKFEEVLKQTAGIETAHVGRYMIGCVMSPAFDEGE